MSNNQMSQQAEGSWKAKVQKFGSYLSGMIMPNIGAFIAWGIITALFIPDGWLPHEGFAQLVDPMINFLLPLLIGYTGGKMVYDARGGVVGAIATMGVIVGADIPMFLGAMIMGPLSGFLMKKVDQMFEGKVRQGFEMLVNNFSAGILGAILTLIAYVVINPVVVGLNTTLAAGVQVIIQTGLLPLVSIFIEPAKVLFLNNAINHGILSPIGADQAAETGKSILFMLEANPGPGLGILLAYWFFGKGMAKTSSPGAAIIHFFGGIHEIYFPYILMKLILILAAIAGGMSGVFTFVLFNVGLVAVPSPGSIFAFMAMTPRGDHIGVLLGVIVATLVSFILAAILLKVTKSNDENIEEATDKMQAMKGKETKAASALKQDDAPKTDLNVNDIDKIVFACDAGMGSSAMGASVLRNKVNKAGLDMQVTNTSINQLPDDADLVITHKDLTDRAKEKLPNAKHISVENFLNGEQYDQLIEDLKDE